MKIFASGDHCHLPIIITKLPFQWSFSRRRSQHHSQRRKEAKSFHNSRSVCRPPFPLLTLFLLSRLTSADLRILSLILVSTCLILYHTVHIIVFIYLFFLLSDFFFFLNVGFPSYRQPPYSSFTFDCSTPPPPPGARMPVTRSHALAHLHPGPGALCFEPLSSHCLEVASLDDLRMGPPEFEENARILKDLVQLIRFYVSESLAEEGRRRCIWTAAASVTSQLCLFLGGILFRTRRAALRGWQKLKDLSIWIEHRSFYHTYQLYLDCCVLSSNLDTFLWIISLFIDLVDCWLLWPLSLIFHVAFILVVARGTRSFWPNANINAIRNDNGIVKYSSIKIIRKKTEYTFTTETLRKTWNYNIFQASFSSISS